MNISGETKIVGLIGNPIEHSISPPMHNAAFQESDLDFAYVTFKVEKADIEKALDGIRGLEIEGINVTIPHKSTVNKYLDEIEDTAEKIGAVNTIKRDGKKLKGFNTDGKGVLKTLRKEIGGIKNKNILLLGAGGAARAIGFTLAENGANLTISNRTESKAKELASEISKKTSNEVNQIPQNKKELRKAIRDSKILINSTSVGMYPNEGETLIESDSMHENLIVMDIVYNPLKTRLLEEAEKAGAKTIPGLRMLVHQGAASFKIWTGQEAPVKAMWEAAEEALKGR